MKFTCMKNQMEKAVSIVQKAVSVKSTMTILEGILIEANDNGLKLTGNDLKIGIECKVHADIIEKGALNVNSKMFGEIIRKLPDTLIEFELKENMLLNIKCEHSNFDIKVLSPEGFPSLPEVEKLNYIELRQDILKEMIRQTIFSVGIDENRPVLTGELLEIKNNEITIVAIDGFRMSIRKRIVKKPGRENISVIIPGNTMSEISKILEATDKKIKIYYQQKQVMFETEQYRMTSRLIDGEYINYKGIIPDEYELDAQVNKNEMIESIERISVMITNEEKRYPMGLKIEDEKMIFNVRTDMGEVEEEVDIEMEGENVDVSFNPKYFIEALRQIEEEKINIKFSKELGYCLITSITDDEYMYLILPVRR